MVSFDCTIVEFSSSPNLSADCESDEGGSSPVLADADNRQKQWKQMSGRNGGITKVDTILFCPLVHYVAFFSQERNKSRQNFDNFGRETMISIYNYVNDDRRLWKINAEHYAAGECSIRIFDRFKSQKMECCLVSGRDLYLSWPLIFLEHVHPIKTFIVFFLNIQLYSFQNPSWR